MIVPRRRSHRLECDCCAVPSGEGRNCKVGIARKKRPVNTHLSAGWICMIVWVKLVEETSIEFEG